jgi:hypothetical protein
MITSNKAEVTPDLANRSSCVRILKQPRGYQFPKYPEGDLLDHVKAKQSLYLGAVFAIVAAWHSKGMPSTNESRHDFRRWARVLDWIVQNLFFAAPLMDGHHQTLQRMTNPALTWLRLVALTVQRSGNLDQWLRAHHLLELVENTGLDLPGVDEHDDTQDEATREKALRGIGKRLATCFGTLDSDLEVDHLVVERRETTDDSGRDRKEYRFRCRHTADQPAKTDVSPHSPHSPRTNQTSFVADEVTPQGVVATPTDELNNRNHAGYAGNIGECGNPTGGEYF